MNTRRAVLLIFILGLLAVETVFTRQAALDFSLRTGKLYANADRLHEENQELRINLAILRMPVMAVKRASAICPNLAPAHPELAAYHREDQLPQLPVPSLASQAAEQAAAGTPAGTNGSPGANPAAGAAPTNGASATAPAAGAIMNGANAAMNGANAAHTMNSANVPAPAAAPQPSSPPAVQPAPALPAATPPAPAASTDFPPALGALPAAPAPHAKISPAVPVVAEASPAPRAGAPTLVAAATFSALPLKTVGSEVAHDR
ncbi:MAG: hypothetical protein ACREJ2_15985 [Planctomycetota bacterium]